MLGKPVEFGFPRPMLRDYLESRGAYPLTDYVPIDLDKPEDDGFTMGAMLPYDRLARGHIEGGVRDDDVDYTILGLHLMETYGSDLTTYDIAREWLTRLPVYQTFTAERATYQNLVREVPLAQTGAFHNPYREWIGALIRADIFGYVTPGDPRRAAELAYRDAVLSHRANGIFGEMWAAALVATAFTAESPKESVLESLRHIPAGSRLAEEIRRILDDHAAGKSWEESADHLDARYKDMSWVHTINNAGALAAAVLWGEGDFTATIAYSVQAGLDTDSIGATAGSWAGAFGGYAGIPASWLEPLQGRTSSAVFGFGEIRLEDMVPRTLRVIEALR
jgi:ADP-ribosylglycohydrolase